MFSSKTSYSKLSPSQFSKWRKIALKLVFKMTAMINKELKINMFSSRKRFCLKIY